MNQGPVFAFTVHRSGGTLLARLLNCHPDLVMWGEHHGIINKLAELDHLAATTEYKNRPAEQDWTDRFIASADFRAETLAPWTVERHLQITRDAAKATILRIFAHRLQPGQRWGLKEIRYHRPYVAQFLLTLFPYGRFILLRRDIADAAVSNVLADWSQNHLKEAASEGVADDVIRDVAYALAAVDEGFKSIAAKYPQKCYAVDYETLKTDGPGTAIKLFEFLGCTITDDLPARLARTAEKKTNTTVKRLKSAGVLEADYIRARTAQILPDILAEIARDGVDRSRLAAKSGVGRYSFLIGDHDAKDFSFSSMF